jgi:hypothetical protein
MRTRVVWTQGGLMFAIVFFLVGMAMPERALCHGDSCPDVPSGGGENIEAWITRVDNGCQVGDDFYVKKGTEFTANARAEAQGECQIRVLSCSPSPCRCVNSGTPQQRTINHIQVIQHLNGSDGYPTKIFGLGPNGGTAFYHVLDSRDPTTSTGGPQWRPLQSGDYLMKFHGVINTTNCNMTPSVTPTRVIPVHVRMRLAQGDPI